jgi:hypothetical protein
MMADGDAEDFSDIWSQAIEGSGTGLWVSTMSRR